MPLLVAAPCIAVVGLVTQQAFLRWNQGQELRQALITIAISVIIADQIIAHFPRRRPTVAQKFGGNAVSLDLAGLDRPASSNLHVAGVEYSLARLVMLALGVAVGRRPLALALPDEDRDGDPRRRRRPADDVGARDQHPADVRDRLRRRLGARGVRRASSGPRRRTSRPGQDGQWLLNSLVVVIVGGMGSIFGAAAGALLYAFVLDFSAPTCPRPATTAARSTRSSSRSSLIALVLAFRPQGLFGRRRVRPLSSTPKQRARARHRRCARSCSPRSGRSVFNALLGAPDPDRRRSCSASPRRA